MNFPILYGYNFFILTIVLLMCQIKILPKKSYIYITTLYFIIVFGQRWFGGVDFAGYFRGYLNNFKFEPGFYTIQNMLLDNNINFGVFIFIIYLFTTVVSLWFFRKFSYSNLGIYLFFISEYHAMSINPLRTYIAINFFLVGIYFIELKNKKILGIIIMIMGLLFHKLILGAIVVYIFCKIINILQYGKILNVILIILPLINLRSILYLITNIFFNKYISYFGGEYDYSLSLMNQIRYYVILFLFLFFINSFYLDEKKEKLIVEGCYIFFIIIGCATYFAALHRIAYFYKIFELLFFVYLLDFKTIKKDLKILIIGVLLLNYVGIIYKDMSTLFYYKLKPLELHATKNYEEYYEEINKYYEAHEAQNERE